MTAGLLIVTQAACQKFFACVFWFASIHKLRNLESFSAILRDYGLPELAPRKLIAVLIAIVEFTLATSMLAPTFSTLATQSLMLLLGVYTLLLFSLYISGKKVRDCGCGIRYQATGQLTLWPVVRNAVLLLIAAFTLLPLGVEVSGYDWLVVIPLAVLLLLAYWIVEELQSNHLARLALQEAYE